MESVELLITINAEMSQLEAVRKIYSHGSSNHLSTQKLLRVIDVRMTALKQDLHTSCVRVAVGERINNLQSSPPPPSLPPSPPLPLPSSLLPSPSPSPSPPLPLPSNPQQPPLLPPLLLHLQHPHGLDIQPPTITLPSFAFKNPPSSPQPTLRPEGRCFQGFANYQSGYQFHPPAFLLHSGDDPPWRQITIDNLGLEDKAVFKGGSIVTSAVSDPANPQ